MAGFVWGDSGTQLSPEQIERRRQIEDAILAKGVDTSPVGHWSQGAARVANALAGSIRRGRLENAERSGRQSGDMAFANIASLLSGSQPSMAPPASGPVPDSQPPGPIAMQGIPPATSYQNAVRAAESGGNDAARNPNSTATGRYQFLQGTWADLARRHPDLALTPDGRADPAQQERAMQAFTQDNAFHLGKSGIEPTPANLYAAHFLGAGGAVPVLKAPDATPMTALVSPEVMKANPNLSGMTAGDFRSWAATKGGGNAPANITSAMAPQEGAGIPAAAITAMGNPWMSAGQRAVAMALLQNRIKQNDPLHQLQMEKAKLGIEKLKGGATEYGLNPVYGQDGNGNTVIGTIGKNGTFKKIDTGDFKVQSGVEKIDLGTQYQLRDRKSGLVVGYEPKNLAGAEAQKAEGKAQGTAKAEYDSIVSKMPGLESVVKKLDDLSGKATYTMAGKAVDFGMRQANMEPREAAIARAEYTAMVDNQILPILRDTFGAQFTQKEGETLRATLGDPDKSPKEKQALLNAFIEQKRRDVQALGVRVGITPKPQAAPSGKTSGGVSWSVE